jgi:hypothetical protein
MASKSSIIGFKEFRENSEKYINAVALGKSFTIVRRSKPILTISAPVDDMGDEGTWETIIDFTKIKKGGVPAEEILASLNRLKKHE